MHENLAFFAILPILRYLHNWDWKKINQRYIFRYVSRLIWRNFLGNWDATMEENWQCFGVWRIFWLVIPRYIGSTKRTIIEASFDEFFGLFLIASSTRCNWFAHVPCLPENKPAKWNNQLWWFHENFVLIKFNIVSFMISWKNKLISSKWILL